MRILFNVHFIRELPEFVQCQITQIIHRTSQGRLSLTDEMAQGGQVSQTRNAAGPNRLNTTAIPYFDESLQVPHQGVGMSVQGESQLVTPFSLNVRLLSD